MIVIMARGIMTQFRGARWGIGIGEVSIIYNINVIHSAGAIRVNKYDYFSGVSRM